MFVEENNIEQLSQNLFEDLYAMVRNRLNDEENAPFVLVDTDIIPLLLDNNSGYRFEYNEDEQSFIAILKSAIFMLETQLRDDGFIPSYDQGVICSLEYDRTTGYDYREDVHWSSISPVLTIAFEDH